VQYFKNCSLSSSSINVHDWAFHALDGNLYTVEQNSNILYKATLIGVVDNLGVVPIISGRSYTYGAVYFDLLWSFMFQQIKRDSHVIRRKDLDGTTAMDSIYFTDLLVLTVHDVLRLLFHKKYAIMVSMMHGDGFDCEDPSCSKGYTSSTCSRSRSGRK
jgi:hypothetical protein